MPDLVASRDLLDSLDVPVLLLAESRIVLANAAAHRLLGDHIDGQDIRLAIRQPDAVATAIAPQNGRVRLDGVSVPGSQWEMACHILADGTRLISFTDISVAVSVARAHADFVANASHELRTPLAAILGYVETLKDPKAGDDIATRNRFLDIVDKEARRMQALVEDLMSLSRIEAVKHDAPTEAIDLLAVAREVAGESHPRERVTVACNQATAMIAGDRGQIEQVIRNLVDNGIKCHYQPDCGLPARSG
jgi:two-component system, OmpR family, phosphate regulon sensor histidine kinase PhoR